MGFNIPWLLMDLRLPLGANRLVGLGAEQSYQYLCQHLARRYGHMDASVFLPHKLQYDRCWASMLIDVKGLIEFT